MKPINQISKRSTGNIIHVTFRMQAAVENPWKSMRNARPKRTLSSRPKLLLHEQLCPSRDAMAVDAAKCESGSVRLTYDKIEEFNVD